MDRVTKIIGLTVGGSALAGVIVYVAFFRKPASANYGSQYLKDKKGKQTIPTGVQVGGSGQVATVTQPNWNNPFDRQYEQAVKAWIAPKRIKSLAADAAKRMAESIYTAKGVSLWSDDKEEVVQQVFGKQVKDKIQIAQLSKVFWELYQKDLWEFIRSFLSAKELENYVHKPVRNLPNYRLY